LNEDKQSHDVGTEDGYFGISGLTTVAYLHVYSRARSLIT